MNYVEALEKLGWKRHRVHLPPQLLANLKSMAKDRGRARDEVVRKCFELGTTAFLEREKAQSIALSNPVAPTIS